MTQIAPGTEMVEKQKEKKRSDFLSWVSFLIILASVFLFFKYVIGITIISGYSMSPTLSNKDVIVTSNLFYTPQRNDIVVYKDDQGNHIIKRVIGLPNDTIEITDGIVFVNESPIQETYTIGKSEDMNKVTINNQSYFLIGDNRNPGESLDSRSDTVGPIKLEQLTGKAIFSLLPFKLSFD